jgi:hypothetical protein
LVDNERRRSFRRLSLREILIERRRHVFSAALDTNALRNANECTDCMRVFEDIDRIAQQQPRVAIAHVQGNASEGFDEMLLHGRQLIFAPEIDRDAGSDRGELLGLPSATIELGASEELELALTTGNPAVAAFRCDDIGIRVVHLAPIASALRSHRALFRTGILLRASASACGLNYAFHLHKRNRNAE